MAGTKLHGLTEGADVNRLVTLNAADVVISWSESIGDGFAFAEDELIVFESAVAARRGRHRFGYAFVNWGA